MKNLLYVLSFAAVIALAFWAYEENYQTQQVLDETEDLEADIGRARARLAVLRAEWAYLNRPDRLRELTELNFSPLGLLPLRPDQFGKADQVEYPAPKAPRIDYNAPVDVSTLSRDRADGATPGQEPTQ
jgi:hypothetical protein